MLKAVTVTNYLGNSLKLELMNPASSGFAIRKIDGLGPAKAGINVTDVSTNDGSLFNSARLEKRNIVLDLVFQSYGGVSIEELRLKTYKYFPIKKKVTLLFETDNRTASIEGYVETNEPDIFSELEACSISIICPDPYFYSAGPDGEHTTVFSGLVYEFEFPFENNSTSLKLIEMGTITNLTEQTVYYDGDADTGVTLVLHSLGQVDNPTIYNVQTREQMRIDTTKLATLTGYGIIAGDEITIVTVKGSKSITLLRNGITTNILNTLDKDADWFQLSKGDNIFTYDADYGSANLQFKVINKVIFEGV